MAEGDIYQVTDVQVLDTRGISNIYYFRVETDDSTVDATNNVHLMFFAKYIPVIRVRQSDQLMHDSTIVKRLAPITSVADIFDVGLAGAEPGAGLPNSQTVVINHTSLPNSRQNRGRMFYAGILRSDEQRGRLLHTPWKTWNDVGELFKQTHSQGGVDYKQVHWNRKENVFLDIASYKTHPTLSKLARRIPRRTPIS